MNVHSYTAYQPQVQELFQHTLSQKDLANTLLNEKSVTKSKDKAPPFLPSWAAMKRALRVL